MKESVCCVIGDHTALNCFVACILQTTVHGATRPSFHLAYWKIWQQIGCIFKAKVPGLRFLPVQLLAAFVVAYRAAHTNRHSDVISCIFVCKMHVEQRCFCLCLCYENIAILYNVGDICKIFVISRQRRKTIRTHVVVLGVNLNMQIYFTNILYVLWN